MMRLRRALVTAPSSVLLLLAVLGGCATPTFQSQVESKPVPGGSGEGWAGIEGEPIPFDSSDPKYKDYLDRVRRMIREKWGYPCVKNVATGHCDYKSARLVIVFGILKDGRVPVVAVTKESGYEIYDEYAKNAIMLAQPFPPVPSSLMAVAKPGSSGVKIVATFDYKLVDRRGPEGQVKAS